MGAGSGGVWWAGAALVLVGGAGVLGWATDGVFVMGRRGAGGEGAVLLAEDLDVDGPGGAWGDDGRPLRRTGEQWPWERDPAGWATARRDNEAVEARHWAHASSSASSSASTASSAATASSASSASSFSASAQAGEAVATGEAGRSIAYFVHVHKGGWTSVCASARANGELTTRSADSKKISTCGHGGNCNLAWVPRGQERWWRRPLSPWPWNWWNWGVDEFEYRGVGRRDGRVSGRLEQQAELVEELAGVCEDEDYLSGLWWPWMRSQPRARLRCGVSFVANEGKMSPTDFWIGPARPWVYVAVIRDPLDLVLSQHYMHPPSRTGLWVWEKARPPTERDLMNIARAKRTYGHLAVIFSGLWGGTPMNPAPGALRQALDRLPHFSVLIDTSHDFEGGFSALAHKLGWGERRVDAGGGGRRGGPRDESDEGAELVRRGTRAGSKMRLEPAYQSSVSARRALKASFYDDLEFYRVAAEAAADLVDALALDKRR